MNAAHTCATTARHLVEDKNADYLMAVKGNREALYTACRRVASGLVSGGQVPHVVTETSTGGSAPGPPGAPTSPTAME
ncbi:hypothetical protein [Actinomadura coerulea]|uniref:hypothetical protein n=1 Tax=Actinomadura coerulea TaxID=46159 RepID=UPI0034270FF5